MSCRRHGFGPLVSLLVISTLAFTVFALGAQAATPEFTVNGGMALHASGSGEQLGWASLLTAGSFVQLRCGEFEVIEGLLQTGLDASIKLLYKQCVLLETSSLKELPCHIYVSPTNKSLHITASALLLPIEFASGDYGILAEKINALVLLEGKECPLPLSNVIKGELCLLIESNETWEPLVTTNKEIQESCPERPALESLSTGAGVKDKLLYLGLSFADITARVFLTGPHQINTLGVLLR
jgi:hypothetical protein